MKVHNKEVNFRKTVGAIDKIAGVCAGGDISKLTAELGSDSTIVTNKVWKTIISAMSEGYEMARKFEDPNYVPNPLTMEELDYVDDDDFSSLITEAATVFLGGKVTVEVEEDKKKENETSETSD